MKLATIKALPFESEYPWLIKRLSSRQSTEGVLQCDM